MIERWIAVVVTLTVMVAVVTAVGVRAVVAGVAVQVPSATPGAVRLVVPRARGPPGRAVMVARVAPQRRDGCCPSSCPVRRLCCDGRR